MHKFDFYIQKRYKLGKFFSMTISDYFSGTTPQITEKKIADFLEFQQPEMLGKKNCTIKIESAIEEAAHDFLLSKKKIGIYVCNGEEIVFVDQMTFPKECLKGIPVRTTKIPYVVTVKKGSVAKIPTAPEPVEKDPDMFAN